MQYITARVRPFVGLINVWLQLNRMNLRELCSCRIACRSRRRGRRRALHGNRSTKQKLWGNHSRWRAAGMRAPQWRWTGPETTTKLLNGTFVWSVTRHSHLLGNSANPSPPLQRRLLTKFQSCPVWVWIIWTPLDYVGQYIQQHKSEVRIGKHNHSTKA